VLLDSPALLGVAQSLGPAVVSSRAATHDDATHDDAGRAVTGLWLRTERVLALERAGRKHEALAAWLDARARGDDTEARFRSRIGAQFGQDEWALSVFRNRLSALAEQDGAGTERDDSKRVGFFVDVGSRDPAWYSNSLMLELHGWRGICVEPFPEAYDYSDRVCTLKRAVLGAEDGQEASFVAPGDSHGGIASRQEDQNSPRDDPHLPSVKVKTQTLRTLMKNTEGAPSLIHFLSIDTEGTELDVLRGWPWDTHVFLALAVEVGETGGERSERIRAFLEPRGYQRVAKLGADDGYIHVDGVAQILRALGT
jgi:FkbM family methyltransferase